MEKLVDCTNRIHDLEDANYFLQTENESLLIVLQEMRQELDEKELLENEMHQKLADMSDKLSSLTIENETLKLNEIGAKDREENPITNQHKEIELLNQFRRCQIETKILRDKLMEQNDKIKSQKEEINILNDEREKLHKYNSKLELQSEMATDDRTKSELLEIIRLKIEDKIYWETYAETLLKLILVKSPEILDLSLVKMYGQMSSSELADKWNRHMNKLLKK